MDDQIEINLHFSSIFKHITKVEGYSKHLNGFISKWTTLMCCFKLLVFEKQLFLVLFFFHSLFLSFIQSFCSFNWMHWFLVLLNPTFCENPELQRSHLSVFSLHEPPCCVTSNLHSLQTFFFTIRTGMMFFPLMNHINMFLNRTLFWEVLMTNLATKCYFPFKICFKMAN